MLNFKKPIITSLNFLVGSIIIGLTSFIIFVSAAPPASPYAPGATLTPECAPGDDNCTVYAPLTTSLTANTTASLNDYALDFDSGTLYIDSLNNNVGIGTTSPYAKLSVAGQTVAEYFTATSTSATSTFPYISATQSNVGTVIGGTWNGSAISDSYLDNNLTLASATISGSANTMSLGSDATGDIYYRNSSGYLTNLAMSTAGYVLSSLSGLPTWTATSTIGVQGRGNGSANQISYWTDANTISSSANFIFNPTTNLLTIIGNATTTQFTATDAWITKLSNLAANGFIKTSNSDGTLIVDTNTYASALGADDNYVTDAQLIVIGNTSGTNTGDNAVNTLYSGFVTNATHTGDATGDGVLTIATGAVTYAKMQNISATSRILGRITAGSGSAEELTGANVLTIIGAASAGVDGYMTGTYATKLDGIATGATNVTNTNQLTNGAGFITSADDTVSGTELDGVFSSNGLLKRTGTGTYTVDASTYLTTTGNGSGLTGLTATQVGLGNVTNESKATMFTSPTFTGDISFPGSGIWDSSGNVGIGTTDPGTSKLAVTGTIESTTGGFKFPDATTQTTAATASSLQQDFVATGSISTGDLVALRSDGTVEIVKETIVDTSAGTPAVFEYADSNYFSATYDSTNQKVVVAYQDWSNSQYGTAVVGTVSGTSISFGTPVVFEYANSEAISTTYDSTNQKVVIAYKDGGNGSYGTAVVGTVSGTSISFGTPAVFEYADSNYFSATYDSTNQKVVVAYQDWSNSQYGTAVVGTVSGTSISFGTPVVFESAATYYISATYDSTNQKVVIAYRDSGNADYGTAIVGTVSGTSISFGTPAVFETDALNYVADYISATYDTTNQKVVIAYRDSGNSYYGTAAVGTVSGTSISFATPVVFESANSLFISATYDTTNQKVVIAYRDSGNSYYGTAAVFESGSNTNNLANYFGVSQSTATNGQTATIVLKGGTDANQSGLTAGSLYFTDAAGALSTSQPAGEHKVLGTALSATKLALNGNPTYLAGNVGIGTTMLSKRLTIDGTVSMANLSSGSAATDINIDANNEIFRVTSSRRYKNNIADLEIDSNLIYNLRPVSFTWIDGTISAGQRDFGLIAEETEEVLPQLVNYNAQGQPESVKYSMLSIFLLNETQKIAREINQLKLTVGLAGDSLQVENGLDFSPMQNYTLDEAGYLVINKIKADEIKAKVIIVDNTDSDGINLIGNSAIEANTDKVTIMNEKVATSSKIFVTWQDNIDSSGWWICDKVSGKSFSVCLDQPVAASASFDYWIILVEENQPVEAVSAEAALAAPSEELSDLPAGEPTVEVAPEEEALTSDALPESESEAPAGEPTVEAAPEEEALTSDALPESESEAPVGEPTVEIIEPIE